MMSPVVSTVPILVTWSVLVSLNFPDVGLTFSLMLMPRAVLVEELFAITLTSLPASTLGITIEQDVPAIHRRLFLMSTRRLPLVEVLAGIVNNSPLAYSSSVSPAFKGAVSCTVIKW